MNTIKEKGMQTVFFLTACISLLSVILICLFILANSIPALQEIGWIRFITGTRWKPTGGMYGILPMILGSIYVTAGAMAVGIPLGILFAVFLVRFCPPVLYRVIKPAVNLLAGIPSVVYGYFGLTLLVPLVRTMTGTSGKGILTASLLLGMMILPTIINVSESALQAVPNTYYEGGLALGATHEQTVMKIQLPAAKSGIFAGTVLGIGRAVGETVAVAMVVGNQAVLPRSITAGVRTLTTNIILEMGYAADLHRQALIATALVLFVFILIINLSVSLMKQEKSKT